MARTPLSSRMERPIKFGTGTCGWMPMSEYIDFDKPVYLSLFGIWSKKSGYAMLKPGVAAPERLVLADKSVERLAKAADAPVFDYVSETFEESPNIFVTGPDLKDAKRVTDTNPFQNQVCVGPVRVGRV